MEHTIDKLTWIGAAFAGECALTGFFAVDEIALIFDFVIVPIFGSFAMLLIFFPVAFVEAALGVAEGAFAVSHAIHPLTLINISISMRHPTKAFKLPILSLTLIHSSIRILDSSNTSPFLSTSSFVISLIWFFPLAEILPTITNILPIIIPDKATFFRFFWYFFQLFIRYHDFVGVDGAGVAFFEAGAFKGWINQKWISKVQKDWNLITHSEHAIRNWNLFKKYDLLYDGNFIWKFTY